MSDGSNGGMPSSPPVQQVSRAPMGPQRTGTYRGSSGATASQPQAAAAAAAAALAAPCVTLQQEQQRKSLELKLDTDLARDKQASEDARGWAELQAKYRVDTTKQAMALREEQRVNDMNFGLKQAQAAQAAQPPVQQPPGPEGGPIA